MPRSSPQTERIVDVLEVLAGSGTRGHSLAELARHLGVDKATCYPMLMELTRVGWLVRHPRRKTFHLGPRLIDIGHAAESAVDVVDLARAVLADLTDRTGLPGLLVAGSGDELVIADVARPRGRGRHRAFGMRAGDRLTLRPPLGAVLVAWSGTAAIERWLSRTDPDSSGRYREILDITTARGFAVEQFPPAPLQFGPLLESLSAEQGYGSRRASQQMSDQLRLLGDVVLVGEIDEQTEYWPISINAPVFDGKGDVSLALCVIDIPGPLDGAAVIEIGTQVMTAAQEVATHAHGSMPPL